MMEENKTKGFMQKPVVQFFVAVLAGLVVPLIFASIVITATTGWATYWSFSEYCTC